MEKTISLSCISRQLVNLIHKRYIANKPPTVTGKRRFRFEVETDANILVNYCCGINFHIDEPLVKLKPDSEYPDWLWNLRLGPKKPSYELEHGTKEYYLRLAEEGADRAYTVRMKKARTTKVVGKELLDHAEYLNKIKFRALAFMEEDYGHDKNALETDIFGHFKIKNLRDFYLPMNKKSVLYKDEIVGNSKLKNFKRDEMSDNRGEPRDVPKKFIVAKQDSRHRHYHAVT